MKEARETYESDLDFLENYIGKYDCLLGSRESIDYLMELEENQEKCHI